MSTYASISPAPAKKRRYIGIVIASVLIGAMALDTNVIPIGSQEETGFSAERYGAEQFPLVREDVEARAIEPATLIAELDADPQAAGERYGVATSIGPVLPITFSGVVGEGRNGIYEIQVAGLPDSLTIRLQTGPAINGTDLRDATGSIEFGQFTNQIEYQDAGAAINDEMKRQVLDEIDTSDLSGERVTATGVFKLINRDNWLVTPVSLQVQ